METKKERQSIAQNMCQNRVNASVFKDMFLKKMGYDLTREREMMEEMEVIKRKVPAYDGINEYAD